MIGAAMAHFDRRPVKARQSRWIRALARGLARRRVPPNVISVASAAAAAATAGCLIALRTTSAPFQVVLLFLAAGFILLRLLANVVDGLVAVEGGLKSRTGDIFNEVPDRLSDVVIIAAAGYAIPAVPWAVTLGWVAAVLALLTAYVRTLGATLGLPQDFSGPMAKAHRMAVMVAACALSVLEIAVVGYRGWALALALAVIAAGSLITFARRLMGIANRLRTS